MQFFHEQFSKGIDYWWLLGNNENFETFRVATCEGHMAIIISFYLQFSEVIAANWNEIVFGLHNTLPDDFSFSDFSLRSYAAVFVVLS